MHTHTSAFQVNFVFRYLCTSIEHFAFAPKDKPQIAIAVYIENGGWGSTWAAPIASLIIEKYLTGQVNNTEREHFILSGNLMDKENEK